MNEFIARNRLKSRRVLSLALLLVITGAIAACAHQPLPADSDLPGFFKGVLHGFTIVFSLIGSIFMDIRIYAFPNSGGWYDFGYVLGASMFLGGSAAGASSGS
jgi:predicted phage tail protein